jgi:hypothetical protein
MAVVKQTEYIGMACLNYTMKYSLTETPAEKPTE